MNFDDNNHKVVSNDNPFGYNFLDLNVSQSLIDIIDDQKLLSDLWLAGYITQAIKKLGGRAILVGGVVRDYVMSLNGQKNAVKDIDMEVYGLDKQRLEILLNDVVISDEVKNNLILKKNLQVNITGKQYGVYKILGLDIALARSDIKTEPGYGRKPDVVHDIEMDFKQAAFRRDLTINSLGMNIDDAAIMDEFGGVSDIKNKVLRHIYNDNPSNTRFMDDPLRVLRVVQFAARFDYSVAPETFELCRSLEFGMQTNSNVPANLPLLARQRVGQEWAKMLAQSIKPSKGLQLAAEMLVFEKIHKNLHNFYENKKADWHNLLKFLDILSRHAAQKNFDGNLKIVYILSFIWVFATVKYKKQNCSFVNTVIDSLYKASYWRGSLNFFTEVINLCADDLYCKSQEKVDYCLRYTCWLNNKMTNMDFRETERLSLQDVLYFIDTYNLIGKQNDKVEEASDQQIEKLLKRANELGLDDNYLSFVKGDDVIHLGVKSGKKVREILDKALELQLKGNVTDREQALLALKKII